MKARTLKGIDGQTVPSQVVALPAWTGFGEPFSGGYRNWHYGVWNANRDFSPTTLEAVAADDQEAIEDRREDFVPELPQRFRTMQVAAAVSGAGAQPGWVSSDPAVFVTASRMHGARIGGQAVVGGQQLEVGATLSPTSSGRPLSVTSEMPTEATSLSVNAGGGLSVGRTVQVQDLRDINGDGLPDWVIRDPKEGPALTVRYNLGTHFGEPEALATDLYDTRIDGLSAKEQPSKAGANPNALRHDTTITASANIGAADPTGSLACRSGSAPRRRAP